VAVIVVVVIVISGDGNDDTCFVPILENLVSLSISHYSYSYGGLTRRMALLILVMMTRMMTDYLSLLHSKSFVVDVADVIVVVVVDAANDFLA